MKLEMTKEWCERMAHLEGDSEIGAGSERKALIDELVSRFLAWPLPENFSPDNGISFRRIENKFGAPYPGPAGTNLLDAAQAQEMIEHLLRDII